MKRKFAGIETMEIRATVRLRNEAMLAARERLGLSQRMLAEASGVKAYYISRLECLDYPKELKFDRVVALAKVLDIPIDDIFPDEMKGWKGQTKFHTSTEISCRELMEAVDRREQRYILPDPSVEMELAGQIEWMKDLLGHLTPRQAEIVKMRYGLFGSPPLTTRETAKQLDVSVSNVNFLERSAIRTMQGKAKNTFVIE